MLTTKNLQAYTSTCYKWYTANMAAPQLVNIGIEVHVITCHNIYVFNSFDTEERHFQKNYTRYKKILWSIHCKN